MIDIGEAEFVLFPIGFDYAVAEFTLVPTKTLRAVRPPSNRSTPSSFIQSAERSAGARRYPILCMRVDCQACGLVRPGRHARCSLQHRPPSRRQGNKCILTMIVARSGSGNRARPRAAHVP